MNEIVIFLNGCFVCFFIYTFPPLCLRILVSASTMILCCSSHCATFPRLSRLRQPSESIQLDASPTVPCSCKVAQDAESGRLYASSKTDLQPYNFASRDLLNLVSPEICALAPPHWLLTAAAVNSCRPSLFLIMFKKKVL